MAIRPESVFLIVVNYEPNILYVGLAFRASGNFEALAQPSFRFDVGIDGNWLIIVFFRWRMFTMLQPRRLRSIDAIRLKSMPENTIGKQ